MYADIGLYSIQRRLYSAVVDVALIRYSQGTGVYNLCTHTTRFFLHTAVAMKWTISVSYVFLIHTVDIRPQLLQNASNLILFTLNEVSFVKWKFTACLYRQHRQHFAQIYSEGLQENVFRPHYGSDFDFSETSGPGWDPHRLFFNT